MEIFSFRAKAILRALSENSRTSVSHLTKVAHCSRITAAKEVKKLVQAFDIRSGIEVNEDALGLIQRHLLVVKFNKKPELGQLIKMFKDDPYVANAYLCDGDFNLIIYAVASDPMKYIVWESLLPGKLGDYEVNIYPSELMHTNFGYFPTTKSIINRFMVNVDEEGRKLLALLAEDSRKSVSELAKELNMSRTTLHYRIFTMHKAGLIKRFTISINKPPLDYIMAYAVNYRFNRTSSSRSVRMMEYYKTYDEHPPILSTFQLLAPMSGSFRFLGIGLFRDRADAVRGAISAHKQIFNQEHVSIRHARIIGIVKGSYPFRSLDIESNYTRFKWNEEDLK